MASPLYNRVLEILGGRKSSAALLTLLILAIGVLLPAILLSLQIINQAQELSTGVLPKIEHQIKNPDSFRMEFPGWLPFHESLDDFGRTIIGKIGEFAGQIGKYLVGVISELTQSTANFLLNFFVMICAVFYFLQDGKQIIQKLVSYSALQKSTQMILLKKGYSVARATIKGAVVIGIIQGALGGLGLWITGIPNAALWGAVMAIASVLPGIGTAIVWIPAVIYLLGTDNVLAGIGLTLWSALVVGSIDNVLRPKLVGSDTQMPDLLILISTFGGLAMFGAVGLIIGPVITALFLAIWDIYRETLLNEQVSDDQLKLFDEAETTSPNEQINPKNLGIPNSSDKFSDEIEALRLEVEALNAMKVDAKFKN